MSVDEAGASTEAPAVIRKNFEVYWHNHDSPVTWYAEIIGSNIEGNLLFLIGANGREYIINLDHVLRVGVGDVAP